MNSSICSAFALCGIAIAVSVHPVFAHEGLRADTHAPAGVMQDHTHKKGDVMIGLWVMHDLYGGASQSGDELISRQAIADAGYKSATQSMRMDMVMFDIMYAPTDKITLMIMPQYNRMTMRLSDLPAPTIPRINNTASHAHGSINGAHSVEGVGDTIFGALYSLKKSPSLHAHIGLAVSAPTGSVSKKNADGTFVHYGMQPGTGTWDMLPSLTIGGGGHNTKWGAQASYVWRTENINKSGYVLGDKFASTVWLSQSLIPEISLSLRGNFSSEGRIIGHYNAAHGHSSTVDRQANYGGQRAEIGFGFNIVPTSGVLQGVRLGAEALVPVWQDVNGIQAPKKSGLQISLSKAF